MADFKLKIESILGGISPGYLISEENQYLGGVNIDPEYPITSYAWPAGEISPVASTTFSTSAVTEAPMWIISPGRDSNVYAYCANGEIVSYNNSLVSETVVSATISASQGNGAAYYNDYIYFATSGDVHRYGPLDNSPAMTLSAWTGALGQPGLSAACSYPSTIQASVIHPNHPMHVHVDNKLYFADYVSATGKACLNWISSKADGTALGSSRDALDIPFGYTITDIESFGNDLAILAIPVGIYSTGLIPRTGKAALFLWDTFSSSFYRQVDLPDPVATAMYNHNGALRIFSGQIRRYVRLLGYTGGNSFTPLSYLNEGSPPLAGAVDALGDMLAFGAYGSVPASFVGVMTYGTRNPLINPQARNVILSPQTIPVNGIITALAFVSNSSKYPVIGYRGDSSATGLTKDGATAALTGNNTCFTSRVFNIGQEFEITRIRIPLGVAVGSSTGFTVKVYVDHKLANFSYSQVSNVNYNGLKVVDLVSTSTGNPKGNTDFHLHITWDTTEATPIMLPITIWGRTLKDF